MQYQYNFIASKTIYGQLTFKKIDSLMAGVSRVILHY